MTKMRRKTIIGKVWSGFVGEYKKPPIYIIPKPQTDGIFIDDILRKFITKEVLITIKELPTKGKKERG